MKLGLELPTKVLTQLSQLTDIDFCLAQNALEDPEYAKFFKGQSAKGRMVILDNGFHEMGHPLSIPELEKAFGLVNPSFVVSPDWFGKPIETFDAFQQAKKVFPKEKLAVCLAANGEIDLPQFFMNVCGEAGMLCLPYRANRKEWFISLIHMFPRMRWPKYLHLFGMSTFDDLLYFREATIYYGWKCGDVSVDTAKPIKHGLLGKYIHEEMDLRHADISSITLHKQIPNQAQLEACLFNIAYLRRFT